jgi:hypothetical protein
MFALFEIMKSAWARFFKKLSWGVSFKAQPYLSGVVQLVKHY